MSDMPNEYHISFEGGKTESYQNLEFATGRARQLASINPGKIVTVVLKDADSDIPVYRVRLDVLLNTTVY